MRIAVVYDCIYPWTRGGAERLFRGYAEVWAAEGHHVTFLTRLQWEEDDVPRIPGVTVEAIAPRTNLYDGSGTRRPGPAVGFALAVGRALLARRSAYDVVYVSAIPSLNVLAAVPALFRSRTRVVVDWLEIWRPEQWVEYSGPLAGRLARWAQSAAVRMTSRAVCYSRLHARRLSDLHHRGRTYISPGLLDSDAEVPPAVEPDDRVDGRLLFVGRHIPDKHVEQLPSVVAQLRASGRASHAVVVGDGPTRAAAEEAARRLEVEDACQFVGFVPQAQLDQLMRTAACLVNPSVREGYGLVITEAAAHGLPSVVVEAPDNAAAELVLDGVNGYRAADEDDLARAVVAVLDGGQHLRTSTRAWFERSAKDGTVRATALGLLRTLVTS